MRHAAATLAASVLLAVPALALNEEDRFVMQIDAGRLAVMMDQSAEILHQPPDGTGASIAPSDVLKAAVRNYHRLLPVACKEHRFRSLCSRAWYNPRWLDDPREPSLEVLRARLDEAYVYVPSLWGDLCGTLDREHEPWLCQME